MSGSAARELEEVAPARARATLVLVPAWEPPALAVAGGPRVSRVRALRRLARRLARVVAISLVLYLTAVPEALPATPAKPMTPKPAAAAPRPAATKPAPATPAAPPLTGAQRAWQEARALADQGKHDDALRVIHEGLRANPDDTGLLWLEAGVHSWAGRPRESVILYERLVAKHPEMAREVRSDLANARFESGDYAGAAREFEQRMIEEPGDTRAGEMRALALARAGKLAESLAAYDSLTAASPANVDLALDRARVLAWMGKHDRAVAAYDDILSAHPNETRAQLGRAQNENWGGNHRRAIAEYQAMLDAGSTDPEVRKGLAQAYYWAGQPDSARATLDAYLAENPEDREAAALAANVARDQRPSVRVGYARSDDSDGLRVETKIAEVRYGVGPSTTLMGFWRRDDVEDAFGDWAPERIGAGVEQRWNERWSTSASLAWLDPGGPYDAIGAGEITATFRPQDRLRVDGGVAKDVILTRRSLEVGIVATTLVLGADWQVSDGTTARAAERIQYTNDDNRVARTSLGFSSLVMREARYRVSVGATFDYLGSKNDLDNGYYDPERYVEFGPTVFAEWRMAERKRLTFDGRAGLQKENDADREPYTGFTAVLELPLGERFDLTLMGGRSNSNLSSATGFESSRWAVYLSTWF